ncbi:Pimeloyl-ACP methyl ester carboxylesterase [Amycolatopsis pretoriensis]|uniref:Pimeloyl-ACP methyl ester carboxylesterase n=1 Tax=Amycolatopsis pretoriensis TaxID=218821 RepID=A0A1H5R7X1_9PSEU|nr:alpha/beta hydrolase [Amycolatopsis pretoriensis]SEF34500.1 Pimeloyl-ACP methyl ester carboxylesterase [Amycolatopsis pretoriensis]
MAVTERGGARRRLITMPPTAGVPDPVPLDLPGRGRTVVTDVGPRDAPALVLLHSVACTGLLTWYPALDRLARDHRVVVFDQRWHGRGIRSPEFRLADCAEDVTAVADALGIGRFALAGYSMGGMVAQLVAHAEPERVTGLVLCSTASNFRRGLRQRVALDVFGRTLRQLRERVKLPPVPAAVPRERVEDYRWGLREFRSTTPWEIAVAVDEIGRFDSTPWLPSVRLPAAVVVTTKDRFISPDHQRSLARRLPGAATYEVAAGHAACVLAAGRWVPALLAAVHSL